MRNDVTPLHTIHAIHSQLRASVSPPLSFHFLSLALSCFFSTGDCSTDPFLEIYGSICLDMLDLKWNPDYDVVAILATMQLMLGDPNPYSPANQQTATMLIEKRIDYYKKAERIAELSWKAV